MNNKEFLNKTKFKEICGHSGSKNYEVLEIVPKQNEADYFMMNSQLDDLSVNSYFEPKSKKKEEIKYATLKIDFLGNTSDSYKAHTILQDGTMWDWNYYVNWLINKDSIKHKFIDPFSGKSIDKTYEFAAEETNSNEWMNKFTEFYEKADYVYIYMNMYYLKVKDKWYFMENTLEGTPEDFKTLYPAKEDQDVRMIPLKDIAPEYYHPQQGAEDNGLIKMKEYESTFFEKEEQGLNSYSYSAGWWYLEIYMPLGDTLRIKRYSNYEDPEIQLYKVPSAYGGRDDVLFIVQKPEEMFPEQVGGMYVIRPRDMKQPERRFKSVSYGKRDNGEEYIIKSEDSEAYLKWSNNQQ